MVGGRKEKGENNYILISKHKKVNKKGLSKSQSGKQHSSMVSTLLEAPRLSFHFNFPSQRTISCKMK